MPYAAAAVPSQSLLSQQLFGQINEWYNKAVENVEPPHNVGSTETGGSDLMGDIATPGVIDAVGGQGAPDQTETWSEVKPNVSRRTGRAALFAVVEGRADHLAQLTRPSLPDLSLSDDIDVLQVPYIAVICVPFQHARDTLLSSVLGNITSHLKGRSGLVLREKDHVRVEFAVHSDSPVDEELVQEFASMLVTFFGLPADTLVSSRIEMFDNRVMEHVRREFGF
jgi:hypothetical protein